jgi:AraC-like DNA-binding protein
VSVRGTLARTLPPRGNAPPPAVVLYSSRERARAVARAAFPRRRARLLLAKTPDELEQTFRSSLVDATIIDLAGSGEETWRAARLAREFPSVPFFGLTTLRASESPALAQCAALDFADVLVESVDDTVLRHLVLRQAFSTRFAIALYDPPEALALSTPLQQQAWRGIVGWAGRPVRTQLLADALKVTREHLSRTFAAEGAPNLKRVIDLVRLIAAAELAKNPGYDVRDVAEVLDFASSSHLSSTAQRIVGTKPTSLARLRAVDLVERFTRGHGRSRG